MNVREQYHKTVYRFRKGVKCAECGDRLPPRQLNRHVKEKHGLNVATTCTWCLASLIDLFPEKAYVHRMTCLRERYKRENSVGGGSEPVELVTSSQLYMNEIRVLRQRACDFAQLERVIEEQKFKLLEGKRSEEYYQAVMKNMQNAIDRLEKQNKVLKKVVGNFIEK